MVKSPAAQYLCEACGHPAHHCATAGQCCGVQQWGINGDGPISCDCPSYPPSSSECPCQGAMWWLRNHGLYRCGNDYHVDESRCCTVVWDGLPEDAREGKMGHPMHCRKRLGHSGAHSTHNDCGAITEEGHVCGETPGPTGSCEWHLQESSVTT